jgi:hypothetical protein
MNHFRVLTSFSGYRLFVLSVYTFSSLSLYTKSFLPVLFVSLHPTQSRGSSVGIATGYKLNDRNSRVRFPAGSENFSLLHSAQTGSGAHPASYSLSIGISFPGVKLPGRETNHSPALVP